MSLLSGKTSKTGSAQYGTHMEGLGGPGLPKHVLQDFPPFFFFVHPCHTPTLVYFFFFFSPPNGREPRAWVPRESGFRLRRLRKIHKDFGKVTFTQKGL